MNKKGFTLVELVISLSLMVMIIGITTFAFGQAIRTWRKVAWKSECLQVANLVMERICRDIRAASEISQASSSKELILKIGSETVSYQLVNFKVQRQKGRSVAYLTNEREVENLFFSYPEKDLVEVGVGGFTTYASTRN